MKFIFLVYDSALNEMVIDELAKVGATKFTQLPKILGSGGTAEPRLNDGVWPGTNNGLLIGCDDELAVKVMAAARKLRQENPQEGVKAFVLPLEEVL